MMDAITCPGNYESDARLLVMQGAPMTKGPQISDNLMLRSVLPGRVDAFLMGRQVTFPTRWDVKAVRTSL